VVAEVRYSQFTPLKNTCFLGSGSIAERRRAFPLHHVFGEVSALGLCYRSTQRRRPLSAALRAVVRRDWLAPGDLTHRDPRARKGNVLQIVNLDTLYSRLPSAGLPSGPSNSARLCRRRVPNTPRCQLGRPRGRNAFSMFLITHRVRRRSGHGDRVPRPEFDADEETRDISAQRT
jgi:hypothetical protein